MLKETDLGSQQTVSVDALCDVILNKLRVPMLGKTEVIFLARKYIQAMPNQVQYEHLMDDFQALARSGVFGSMTNSKALCTFLRKACLLQNAPEPETFFRSFIVVNQQNQLLTLQEFMKGCQTLQLVPDVC